MTYVAVRQNGKALAVTLLLTAGIPLCVFLSLSVVPLRPLWQSAAMLLTIATLQLSQRYLSCCFEYHLDAEEELPFRNRLTVVQVTRRRRRILCTVPLTAVCDVLPYAERKSAVSRYGKIKAQVNLCPDLRPAVSYLLLWEENGVFSALRLQCDAVFAQKLRERIGL